MAPSDVYLGQIAEKHRLKRRNVRMKEVEAETRIPRVNSVCFSRTSAAQVPLYDLGAHFLEIAELALAGLQLSQPIAILTMRGVLKVLPSFERASGGGIIVCHYLSLSSRAQ